MVDNHLRLEGGARGGGMVIGHDSHCYHASTVYIQPNWSLPMYLALVLSLTWQRKQK